VSFQKDVRDIVRGARRAGWTVRTTNGGHLRFNAPSGESVYAASTPSDPRSVATLRAHLKRRGLLV
jgi:hypothetical protein